MEQLPLIEAARRSFHQELLSGVLAIHRGVPSNADRASKISVEISSAILSQLASDASGVRLPGQQSGSRFERVCEDFVSRTFLPLNLLRPGQWKIERLGIRDRLGLARYEQYQHLEELSKLAAANTSLASALGTDYIISPDIVIGRSPESDESINSDGWIVGDTNTRYASLRSLNNQLPILHASISCKWTIRSDRAQNARSEALNLIRNRKGPLPHIVAVTGEPVPSRIASLALGTGDIDCVYHFALPELVKGVKELGYSDAEEMLNIMVSGRRLRDISDLPLDLAS